MNVNLLYYVILTALYVGDNTAGAMTSLNIYYLLLVFGILIIQNNNQHLCIFYVRIIILNIWAYFSVSSRWNKLNNY